MDVLIPTNGESFWGECNELRYCLRSIEQNLIGVGNVWIVGKKPEWCTGVMNIQFDNHYKNNKSANIINKIMRGCMEPDLTPLFVRMSDDNYFLKPVDILSLDPVCGQNLAEKRDWDDNDWGYLMNRTRVALKKKGLPFWDYETHIPMTVDKKYFLKTMIGFDYGAGDGYVTNSLYFNSVMAIHTQIDPSTRAVFMDQDMKVDFKDATFLCHNDLGLSFELQAAIEKMFPKKSKYEL